MWEITKAWFLFFPAIVRGASNTNRRVGREIFSSGRRRNEERPDWSRTTPTLRSYTWTQPESASIYQRKEDSSYSPHIYQATHPKWDFSSRLVSFWIDGKILDEFFSLCEDGGCGFRLRSVHAISNSPNVIVLDMSESIFIAVQEASRVT